MFMRPEKNGLTRRFRVLHNIRTFFVQPILKHVGTEIIIKLGFETNLFNGCRSRSLFLTTLALRLSILMLLGFNIQVTYTRHLDSEGVVVRLCIIKVITRIKHASRCV